MAEHTAVPIALGMVWPSGYYHYIAHHNVKPTEEFFNHVVNKWAEWMCSYLTSNKICKD